MFGATKCLVKMYNDMLFESIFHKYTENNIKDTH